MVGAVKSLAYTIVSLLALIGLLAACEILQGLAVISTSVHIAGAMYWFIKELRYVPDLSDENHEIIRGSEQVPNKKLDSLSVVLAGCAFSVLMLLYSKNGDRRELYSRWAYFPLLAVCILSLCSAFIGCLSKMVISSYSLKTRPWKNAEVTLSYITYPLLFVATLSSFLHALYRNYAL